MLQSGESLVFVLAGVDKPGLTTVRVERIDPLTLLVPSNEFTNQMKAGSHATLIRRDDGSGTHTSATVRSVTRYGLSHVVEVEEAEWIVFDRRRAPRFEVDLPAELTVVSEAGGSAEIERLMGQVVDLSVVGCRLRGDPRLPSGTLVALRIESREGEDDFTMLCIITRANPDGGEVALEFFDFTGSSRFRLSEFLSGLENAA